MFVNLAVTDVARSRAFFARLGFRFDEMLCDSGTACMRVNAHTMVVLQVRRRFVGYAASDVADVTTAREVVVTVSASSRAEVDRRTEAALRSGGTSLREPVDLDDIYARSFCDLDGHAWDLVWMDGSRIRPDDQRSGAR